MASNNAINLKLAGIPTYDGASSFTASTTTQYSLLLGGATNLIANLGVATNGQLPIGSTGANPTLATLTAGTGITITNAAGSITINGTGGGMTWTEVLGTSQAMAADNGYITNNGALVTCTLPATAAIGQSIEVQGKGAGLWKIAQNLGQTIHFGTSDTTPGVGGSLAATNRYDCIHLRCITANTDFAVHSSLGNITVV